MSEINDNFSINFSNIEEGFLRTGSLIKEPSKLTPSTIIIGMGDDLRKAKDLLLSMPEDIPIVIIDNNPTFVNPPLDIKIEPLKYSFKEEYCFIPSPSISKKSKYKRNLKYKR